MPIQPLCRHIGPNGLNHCPFRDGRTGKVCRFTHRGDPGFEEKFLASHNRPFEGPDARTHDRSEDRRQHTTSSSTSSRQPRPPSPQRLGRKPSVNVSQVPPTGKPPADAPSQPKPDSAPSAPSLRNNNLGLNTSSDSAVLHHPRTKERAESSALPPDPSSPEGLSNSNAEDSETGKIMRPTERAICQLVDVVKMRLEQVQLKKEADLLEGLEAQAKLARMDPQNLASIGERHRENRVSLQRLVSAMESRIHDLASQSKPSSGQITETSPNAIPSQLGPHLDSIKRIELEVRELKQKMEDTLKLQENASHKRSGSQEANPEQDTMEVDADIQPNEHPRLSNPMEENLTIDGLNDGSDQESWKVLFDDLRARIADLEQVQDDLVTEVADGYNSLESKISDAFERASEQQSSLIQRDPVKLPAPPSHHKPSTVSQEEVEMLVTTISETRDALNLLQVRLDTIQLEKLRKENDQLAKRVQDLEQMMEKRKEEKTALSAVVLALNSQASAQLHASVYSAKLQEEVTRGVMRRIQPHLRAMLERNQQFLRLEEEKIRGLKEGDTN